MSKEFDIDKVFNEFLLSMVNEQNVNLIKELRQRWREYLSHPIITPKPQLEKPPLGLIPEWLHKEQRLKEIEDAITRYELAKKPIPFEWHTERSILQEQINSRNPKPQAENKPDWEVLELEYKGSITFWSTGRGYTLDEIRKDGYNIHKVKRLSDGEVFSVGDEVGYSGLPVKITSFEIYEDPNEIIVKITRFVNAIPTIKEIQKLPPQPQKDKQERIEVEVGSYNHGHEYGRVGQYDFITSIQIPKEKFSLIKQAIENILNNENR